MPRESSIQSSVIRYLNSLPGCIAENVSGNSAQSGRADINGCFQGRAFRIELKTVDNGNTPTKKQLHELLKWQVAGAIVMVAYTLEDVKAIFSREGLSVNGWIKHYGEDMDAFCCVHKSDQLIRTKLSEFID